MGVRYAGSADVEKAFDLSEAGSRDGLEWLEAKPRDNEAGFERVRMGFGAAGIAVHGIGEREIAHERGLRGCQRERPLIESNRVVVLTFLGEHGSARRHDAPVGPGRIVGCGEQTFEGRRENLAQANKLSRSFATLLEALNRHRGKGQQKVTVEHVHVHSGGQAVVGMVQTPGGGDGAKSEVQPHARQLAHAPQPAMRRAD